MDKYIKIAEEETIVRCINMEFKKRNYMNARASTTKEFNMIDCTWNQKRMEVYVIVQKDRIIIRFKYPFKAESSAIPLLALFKATYDADKAFARMNMNIFNGAVGFEYTYVEESTCFDSELFWKIFNAVGHESSRLFVRLSHLAAGKLSDLEKEYYSTVLKNSLNMIEGKNDDDEIFYGFWNMKEKFSDVFKAAE